MAVDQTIDTTTEGPEMGRVVVEATIENLGDLWLAENGHLALDKVRRVTVNDALIDTGATLLGLPLKLITELGLKKNETKRVRTPVGYHDVAIYGTVRLTVQGRQCPLDVMEVSDDTPVLIGQIPLEYLDFVVDPKNQRLIGNPDHGGVHTFDLF